VAPAQAGLNYASSLRRVSLTTVKLPKKLKKVLPRPKPPDGWPVALKLTQPQPLRLALRPLLPLLKGLRAPQPHKPL
jgi:hypothetical protein